MGENKPSSEEKRGRIERVLKPQSTIGKLALGLVFGILLVGAPPVGLVAILIYAVYRYRSRDDGDTTESGMSEVGTDQESEKKTESDDPTHSSGDSEGWTNYRVREGYNVDGSESRIIASWSIEKRVEGIRKSGTLIRKFPLGSTILAAEVAAIRITYPVMRLLGGVLGWDRGVEQMIAESEYVIEHGLEEPNGG